MKKILLFMIFGISIIMIGAAGTLLSFDGNFFEGFESGSLTTNNWTLSGPGLAWSVNDGEAIPRTGLYNIRTENTNGESIIETNVDTTNYQNITFSFWGITSGLDGGEYLAADWYNGTNWINVMQIEDIVSYTEYSFNLTDDASNNQNFRIRFRCSSDVNNEECEVDDINVTGAKILNITLSDFYGLNSTLGIINELNTTNLQDIEYGELNFSINSLKTIDSWYLNFSANGTNACSLGNKQSTICYSYPNWIQFIDGVETPTFDGTQGNQGDEINVIQTGSGNQVNVSLRIDEHYNPNVFKWYDAAYNFSDVKWQDGTDQRISNKENMIKMELNQSIIPINADQYKLDFRVNVTGNPVQPLEAYMCNSTYVSGHPHDYAGCTYILQLYPDDLQDDGTKFRGIFSGNSINDIGDFKYILLHVEGVNDSNYYSIKTYNSTASNYTTHWEYSNDAGNTWNNSEDGYETELNINWFYDGLDPTAFVYRFWANTTTGEEKYLEGNITWDIDPTNNYPPIIHIHNPSTNEVLKFPYNITFHSADTNNDNLNVSLYLYQGGNLNTTLVTGMNQSNDTYLWDDLTPDGTYDLVLEGCELNTTDLFCSNQTITISVDNSIPAVFDLNPIENVTYNITQLIEISANVTNFAIDKVLANITYPNGIVNQLILNNAVGDKYNNSFLIPYIKGRYNITIVANDSAGNVNNTETTYFNLVDVFAPDVIIAYPVGDSVDENGDVAISLNITDLSTIDNIYINITSPNGTNYTVTDFVHGLESDNFNVDSLGINWGFRNDTIQAGQACSSDIDTSVANKGFLEITGDAVGTTSCGFVGLKRIDGDFDMNVSFNVSDFGSDTFFILRSSNEESLTSSGIRVFAFIFNTGGGFAYLFGYDDGSGVQTTGFTVTTETFGKLRIKKSNSTTVPVFEAFYFNNSGNSWVEGMSATQLNDSSRDQFAQLYVESNSGSINTTIENFSISGDNFTFAIFNKTSQNGRYNFTVFVNDSLGFINDTEENWFNISVVNDPPSAPQLISPSTNSVIRDTVNILWNPIVDQEGDNLKFNITLLNPNLSLNTTLTTNYGNSSSTSYLWNTTSHADGTYVINVTVYENETADSYSNYGITGSFTVDNTPPIITIFEPKNITYNTTINIPLNFTLIENNPDTCFYSLGGGPNISLASCVNTTINVLPGLNSLILYANDSAGALSSDNITFTAFGNTSLNMSFSINTVEILEEFDVFANYSYAHNGSSISNATCVMDSGGFSKFVSGTGSLLTSDAISDNASLVWGNSTLRVDFDNITIAANSSYDVIVRAQRGNITNDDLRVYVRCDGNYTIDPAFEVGNLSVALEPPLFLEEVIFFNSSFITNSSCSVLFESKNSTSINGDFWKIADINTTLGENNSYSSTYFGSNYSARNKTAFVDMGFSLVDENLRTLNYNSSLDLYELTNIHHGTSGVYTDNVTCSKTDFFTRTDNATLIVEDNIPPRVQIAKVSPNPVVFNVDNVSINWIANDLQIEIKKINITYPNGTLLLETTNSSFILLASQLPVLGNYIIYAWANDSEGLVGNDSVILQVIEINTCTYSSGNWVVDCSDNCVIGSNVDVLGNNISIIGYGNFSTTVNITNFESLYIAGENSTNQCNVYCSGGGCFK